MDSIPQQEIEMDISNLLLLLRYSKYCITAVYLSFCKIIIITMVIIYFMIITVSSFIICGELWSTQQTKESSQQPASSAATGVRRQAEGSTLVSPVTQQEQHYAY